MTVSQRRKISEAIADCNRFIATEEPRNPMLRPTDIQKLLDWYKAHRANLLKMLET